MKKILWHSNAPWVATGYGVQTKLFAPRIADLGYEVAISALYGLEGAVQSWHNIPVFPKLFHPYGQDAAVSHAKAWGADLIVTLIDAWVLNGPQLEETAPWAPWFPIDSDPLPAAVRRQVEHAAHPIVFSKHAVASCEAAGIRAHYVPHGYDSATLTPGDRDQARERLGMPKDAFIVGIVAANKGVPSRKCWPQQLEAFARLRQRHSDAMLYLHTHTGPEIQGVNIPELVEHLGIPKSAVIQCDQLRNFVGGFQDDYMADVYRSIDVLSNVSMGEGFGVPILEAQACGTPVIVGDWTAMSELCFAGWKVPIEEADRCWLQVAAFQYLPRVAAVHEAMEAAYAALPSSRLSRRAVDGAAPYAADQVAEQYWRPVLDRILSDQEPAPPPAPEVITA